MFVKPNPSCPTPIYVQLMNQVKHAADVGAIKQGDQLPGIRNLAEKLAINPNTIAKAYRELEHEGVIELRHGSGAFVRNRRARTDRVKAAEPLVVAFLDRLYARGLTDEEIRRLFEAALTAQRQELVRQP